jgi:uncharacterized GH25 family protein
MPITLMNRCALIAAALVLLSLPTPAMAHDTWLLPARWQLAPGAAIQLELTSGMGFPALDSAVAADRLTANSLRLAGKDYSLATSPAPQALQLSAVVAGEGIAVAWIASRERTLDLTAQEVEEYLEEIGAGGTIGRQWVASGRPAWRETYIKLAKTFVRVGDPTGDTTWGQPVGLLLELVPERDPTQVQAGDRFGVQLLWRGEPLADLAVIAAAARGRPIEVTTDANGRAMFTMDRPGPWLIKATLIRPSERRPGEWESQFTTLTLEVRDHPVQ